MPELKDARKKLDAVKGKGNSPAAFNALVEVVDIILAELEEVEEVLKE